MNIIWRSSIAELHKILLSATDRKLISNISCNLPDFAKIKFVVNMIPGPEMSLTVVTREKF